MKRKYWKRQNLLRNVLSYLLRDFMISLLLRISFLYLQLEENPLG